MIRALITGAGGFCGPYLCRHLSKRGFRVVGAFHPHRGSSNPPFFDAVPLDITATNDVDKLIRKIRPDRIYHLAAQSSANLSWQHPERTLDVNVRGTLHLLQAVKRHVPKARFLFVSSSQVFNGLDAVAASPYAFSKRLAELACLDFVNRFDLPVFIARPSNHTGPGQSAKFVFSDWCRQIAAIEAGRREPVLEVGNLDARRDFLHVEDVVRGYEFILERGEKGKIYHIGSGRAKKLRFFLNYLLRRAKAPIRVRRKASRLRRGDPSQVAGNPASLRSLGWKPRKTIFDALDELLEASRASWKGRPS